MRIFLVDPIAESRQLLLGRIQEALRRVQMKRVEVLDGDFSLLREQAAGVPPSLAILGPGCYQNLEHSVTRLRGFFSKVPIAVVLENNVYASEALELRRFLSVRILPIADIAQMAQLILDTVGNNVSGSTSKLATGTIGVIHTKGGVGASTIATALASCWAHHGRSVALVDLDDVSPILSEWSLANVAKRRLMGELLLEGEVPRNRTSEILAPVPGQQNLFVVPQPIMYGESFHFKSDVIDGAPSSADFIPSLVSALEAEVDLVVIDLARSWGVSTFAALPLCKTVLFVFDEDKTSLKRSMETLRRFYRESDDPAEFDFARWRFVQNGSTQTIIKLEQATEYVNRAELRPEPFEIAEVRFSLSGRDWYLTCESGTPVSLFELCEDRIQKQLIDLAYALFPFQMAASETTQPKSVRDKLRQVVSFLS